MRKILIWVLAIVIIIAIILSSYLFFINSNNKEDNNQNQEQPSNIQQQEVIEYEYLKLGEWGIASKFSSKDEQYEDVNVTVRQMIRGEEAKNIIKAYTENNSYFEYIEPQEGMEWLVVEYEIYFAQYTKGPNGANSDIQTKIKGYGDNENIVIGNKTYETTTQDISDRKYTNEDNIIGRFVTQIPVECEEYVVVFGNRDYSYCEFEGVKNKPEEPLEIIEDNNQNAL